MADVNPYESPRVQEPTLAKQKVARPWMLFAVPCLIVIAVNCMAIPFTNSVFRDVEDRSVAGDPNLVDMFLIGGNLPGAPPLLMLDAVVGLPPPPDQRLRWAVFVASSALMYGLITLTAVSALRFLRAKRASNS